MADLLIALAVDFSGARDPGEDAHRIARSLALGRAGNVRWQAAEGVVMAARAERPVRSPRTMPARFVADQDGGWTLLAGRLFEREELRLELGAAIPASDAELYAAAHVRWGEECDRRLVGNYAAIRWFPAQKRLRLARSPTSDHPLHLWREGTRLVAASIPRALFAAGAPDTISDQSLAELLLLSGPPADGSIYAACSRVPAATAVWIDRWGQRAREFWSIADVPAVRFKRDADYVEAVDAQFRRAVKECLTDIDIPGISLSGGLDSQAVAAYALEELPAGARLKSFTSVPMAGWTPNPRPWKFGDEGAHVRALARMYPQLEPMFLDAGDIAFGEHLEARSLLSSWPQVGEANAHWVDACATAAAAAGCDALLGGDMGNVGFSYDGLTGFPDWLRRGSWWRLLRELRVSGDQRRLWRKFASLAVWPHVPASFKRWRDRNNPWRPSPFDTWTPLREDLGYPATFDVYEPADSRQWRDRVWREAMYSGAEIGLGFHLLHGISQPDPTGFVPLLELCAGMPDEQFLRCGTDRWLARRLLSGKVPEMVRTEKREGLQAADWPLRFARERAGLLEEIDRMKGDPRLAAIFDFDRMRRNLSRWDGTDTVAARHFDRINGCVGRGIATARFIRLAEGRNVG